MPAIDFHVFRKISLKAITLAFPAMLIGVSITACLIRGFYPDMRWDYCLLLGTITSATDPVAVVAMLRELGAKVSLSTTIEGESLLNDGSAVVLFVVLKKIALADGVVSSGGEIVWDAFRMAFLGPIIGWLMGMFSLWWISHIFNDRLVEISISIFTAYLTFYISEYMVKSSGVLSVVCLGFCYASTMGRTMISPEVIHFMHEFWETLGYIANTIIFVITGICISYNIAKLDGAVTWIDVPITIGLYTGGLFIRGTIFASVSPLFKRMPYGWTWKEALISAWGGLRGAVGLALALDIFLTPTLEATTRARILVHASSMVVFTLCINASTLKPLLAFLRYVELSHEELLMLHSVSLRLQHMAGKQMAEIKEDPFLSNSKWDVVRQYADLNELFRPLLKALPAEHHHKKKPHNSKGSHGSSVASVDCDAGRGTTESSDKRSDIAKSEAHSVTNAGRGSLLERLSNAAVGHHHMGDFESAAGRASALLETPLMERMSQLLHTEEETRPAEFNLLAELKHRFHMSVKAGFWHLQHDGTLGAFATDVLVGKVSHKLDDKDAADLDWIRWADYEEHLGPPPIWMGKLSKLPVVGWFVNHYLSYRLSAQYDIAFGFLSVHKHLEHELEHWTEDEKMLALLHKVSHDNIEGARKALIDLHQVLPEVCVEVNTRQAARIMLNAARKKIVSMESHGVLPEIQANMMIAQVETQMRKLQLARMDTDLSKEKVLREVPWMAKLSAETFAILVEAAKEKVYAQGSYLVKQGESDDSVYLVVRGIVEVVEEYAEGSEEVVAVRGIGVVIGEQSLLTGAPRSASARASTSVLALRLPHSAMRTAMSQYPELSLFMWHHVALNLAQKLLGEAEEAKSGTRTSTPEELLMMAAAWVPSSDSIQFYDRGSTLKLGRKMLLLQGDVIEYHGDEAKPTPSEIDELRALLDKAAYETVEAERAAMLKRLQQKLMDS